ncbi:MAG TPA: Na/Pi symporter, partial [Gemmatimonadaceae bacterium]|nr:Na/Pi symporter [Gemmatimonadaceae bacterium]
MKYSEVVLGMVAGLALFLYGVSRLATGMRAVAGERMQRLLARATTNRFAGVATGTVATAVLDSSSVTIIMVIALVDAGLLTFQQSLGVILGANIGTTISSQLIALDVQRYSPVVLAIGLVIMLAARADSWRHAGAAVFGIGLVFFGLAQMGTAVEPLKDSASFTTWMTRLESPVYGVLAGAVITLLLQSSSATVGIAITLASQGLLALPAGVAIMLGAEIGTCADTLLATIGRSRAALRAGVFHLAFNVLTVAVGVTLLDPLVGFVTRLGGGVAQQVATAHVTFNLLGAAALVLLLAPVGRLL